MDINNAIGCDNFLDEDIFVIGCYPSDEDQIEILEKQIDMIRRHSNIHILIVSHYPISTRIQQSVDYVLYDRNNELGDDVSYIYNFYYDSGQDIILTQLPSKKYHATAILVNLKNVLRFCLGRYKRIHYVESDFFFYVKKYLDKCEELFNNGKKFVGFFLPCDHSAIYPGLMSFDVGWMNSKLLKGYNWEDYKKIDQYMTLNGSDPGNLIFEPWFYRYFKTFDMVEESVFMYECQEYVIIVMLEI